MLVLRSWRGHVVSGLLSKPRPFGQDVGHPAAEWTGRKFIFDTHKERLESGLKLISQGGNAVSIRPPSGERDDRADAHGHGLAETQPVRPDDRHRNDRRTRPKSEESCAVLERNDRAVSV